MKVNGEAKTLDQATRAANWITQHRALSGGGFHHGAKDVGGPFLGDSIAMTRALPRAAVSRHCRSQMAERCHRDKWDYIDRTYPQIRAGGICFLGSRRPIARTSRTRT